MVVKIKFYYTLTSMGLALATLATLPIGSFAASHANTVAIPVHACVIGSEEDLTPIVREKIAECIGWQTDNTQFCRGYYDPIIVKPLADEDEIRISANEAELQAKGRSNMKGNIEIRQSHRIVNAQTAYIYRDEKTNKITKIELLGEVRYLETDHLMTATKATLNPQDKSGHIEDVLYRFNGAQAQAVLPAWGRASWVEQFANKDYLLKKATYTTCAPKDKGWRIEAREIKVDAAKSEVVARQATLRVRDWPLLYTPYLSFSTSKARKSGFLIPNAGYSNVGGYDLALPYYWNIAPNYDATIVPHMYTLRGLMIGGHLRFLTPNSSGLVAANVLPQDKAFNQFINVNQDAYPSLRGTSTDRWSFLLQDHTALSSNLGLNINYQQVSDNYYLQDFSSNLAVMTENQLLREGNLTYTTDHWLFSGMAQSYQTLHPINQSAISAIYERLPQLFAKASYNELPMNASFNMLAEFDNYRWPGDNLLQPQGPRYHLNPVLALPYFKPWGYVTPSVQFMENYYDVGYIGEQYTQSFNRTIPLYNVDGGLTFERSISIMNRGFTQTLEPRLNYLYVPYQNQTPIPVYDSAYMIFNTDQLFRTNRFSGFDRVGDTNQVSYALTSRWLLDSHGQEKASLTVGQIRYFADRRVQLCYQQEGGCVDSPLMLGYVSPDASSSPVASRATYQLNAFWGVSGDYVWDPYTHATNNGNLNFHYQPETNHIVNVGYTYLVSGNLLQVGTTGIQNNVLHQATVAVAWPLSEYWSGIGAYSHNISENYSMMTFAGLQYDNCCWAVRFMGGRAFKSLSPTNLTPQYNNNVYIQLLLKGLGSAASSDPASVIGTYLPGYRNMF